MANYHVQMKRLNESGEYDNIYPEYIYEGKQASLNFNGNPAQLILEKQIDKIKQMVFIIQITNLTTSTIYLQFYTNPNGSILDRNRVIIIDNPSQINENNLLVIEGYFMTKKEVSNYRILILTYIYNSLSNKVTPISYGNYGANFISNGIRLATIQVIQLL